MSDELREMLRSVIQEELKPVHKELHSLNDKIDRVEVSLTDKIDRVEVSLTDKIDRVENKMHSGFQEVNSRLDNIERSIHRLEESQPADILAILQNIENKIDANEHKFQAMNKRLSK